MPRSRMAAKSRTKRRCHLFEQLEDRRLLAVISWDGDTNNDGVAGGIGDNANWYTASNWDLGRVPAENDDVKIGAEFAGSTVEVVNFGSSRNLVNSVDSDAILRIAEKGRLEIASESRVAGLILEGRSNDYGPILGGNGSAKELIVDGDLTWKSMSIDRMRLEIGGNLEIATDEAKSLQFSSIIVDGSDSIWSGGDVGIVGSSITNRGTFTFTSNADILPPGPFQSGATIVNHSGATMIMDTLVESNDHKKLFGKFTNNGVLHVREGILELGNCCDAVTHQGQFLVSPDSELVVDGKPTFDESSSIQTDVASTLTFRSNGPTKINGDFQVSGTVNISDGGSIQFAQDVEIPTLVFQGSEIRGPGLITVTDDFHWMKGSMASGAKVVSTGAATLGDIATGGGLNFSGGEFVNQGEATWVAGPFAFGFGTLRNQGIFHEATNASIGVSPFTGGTIINQGTWNVLHTAGVITNTRQLPFQNHGRFDLGSSNVDYLEFIQFDGETALDGGSLTVRGGGRFIDLIDGAIVGEGTLFGNVRQQGGTIAPNGQLTIDGNLTATGGTLAVDVRGTPDDGDGDSAGTNYDQLAVNGSYAVTGEISLGVTPGFMPTLGDSYQVAMSDSRSGSFATIDGVLIDATKAWQVSYASDGVLITVVEATEEIIAGALRSDFNRGVLVTRNQMVDWFNAGDRGLPGSDQRLGNLHSVNLEANVASLLPTLDTPVTTLEDLETELVSAGYQVDAIAGDGNGELLQVSVSQRVVEFSTIIPAAVDSFVGLSKIPQGVQLAGELTYDATTKLTNLELGIDTAGFYVGPSSIFELTAEGGGEVNQQDFPLNAGALTLDLAGTVSVPSASPVSVSLSPDERLRLKDYDESPELIFDVSSSGESTLSITHTLDPTGLTYDGTWSFFQQLDGEQIEPVEVSLPNIAYPNSDDLLTAGVGLLAGMFDTLLGPEAAANFNAISLPLINDTLPADAAPELFGINPADFGASDASWISSLFGAVRGFLEPNDPAAGGQGLFRSEGDFTVGTNTVRYQRSIDGSGVKVGVISTGADGFVYSQLTGDLPVSLPTFPSDLATRSESDSFGGRGTAMMEVIHDLAPGAELAFASANDTDSLLAAVAWMTEVQDVDVIVSDVVDYTESVFTAGPFTRYLAEQIEEHDVLFIQAAGNDGQRAYRDTLSLINVAEAGNATRRLHRFGGSDEVPITTIPVTLAPQSVARFVLQTSQNFLAPSAVVAMQVDELPTDVEINRLGFPIGQTNGRIPNVALNIDSLTLANHSTAEVTVDVAIELINGQLPGQEIEFQLVTLGEAQLQSTRGPQLFGSARLQDVLVVGAVENETPEVASPYSSVGDASLRLPDVAAPSGVDTSGFGFTFGSAFRGTSSAAAHAAAVAALLNQLAPTTTQDEIREAIKASATAIGSGPEDPRSGRGVIDAAAAAQLLAGAPSNTNDPPMDQSGGLQQYLDLLPQWLQVSVLSDQQIENLLSGTDATIVDLMQLRVDLDGDTLGRFDAGFPFNFDGIGSFDEFEISGRVNIEATPDILLQVGWNEDGLYLDAENSRVAASLKGTGEARGYAFETFGVGAGGTVSASPYLDLIQIDRDNNSRIHLDEIQVLADDLAGGQFSMVLPQIDRVDADVYGDLIFGFLDYVDVDPNLPNQKHGGDPFIVRGRAELSIGLNDNEQGWQFGEFGLANPDIDGDGANDYTLGVLAENSLQFGQSIINAIEVPDFVKDLLGEFRFSNESLRRDPLVRPRGMLPETMDEAAEGTLARERIDAHLLSALLDAIASGEEIDADSVRTAATPELAAWFQGAPTTSGSAGAEGEAAAPDSIVARLNVLEGFYTTHNPAETDAFESSLNAAITSYLQWLDAVAVNGLEPEDVVDATTRLNVRNGLIRALDHAIHRSHTEAIQLHLADPPAPLNHLVVDGVVAERGVFDRAIEAVRWAQTAEYLELATVNNGLTVAQALDELVINVVVESATLSVKGEDGAPDTNGVISGDSDPNEDNRIAQLNIQGGWQIKLPPDGEAPDINAHTSYDRFSETIRDAGGNLVVTMAGAGNRNFIAGDPLASAYDPIQTSFNPLNDYLGINRLEQLATYLNRQDRPDLLPITQGELDVNGSLTTSVRLGEGDTFAQVQYEVGLPLVGLINDKTNVIQGRPELNVFVGTLSEDVLTRDRATVRQGQAVSVEARVRRGNGPLTDGTLSFALEGPGFLDTASLQTTLVVPRTPLDGFAKTIFEAPAVGELTEVTIAATLTDNGRLYTDSARIEIVRNDVPQMEVVSYFLGIPQQPIAPDVRAQLSELLQETGGEITEAVSEAARVPLIQWFDDSVHPLVITARDLAENAGESDDAYIAASDAARIAGSNYVEWFGVANSLLDPAALFGSLPAVTQDLLDAVATLSENRIVDFQATAETEGLSSLYEALSWAFSGSTVLDLPFDFQPATPWVDRLEVLDRSGIAIEWLVPPDSPADATPGPQITGPQITGPQITGSQITGSQITGGSDEASLKVAARIVIRDGQQLTPVMQDGLPAPVEINLIPQGLSSATVTTPLPSTTAEQLSQGQQRRAFLGSRYAPTQFEETETYVVESASVLEATAERGPSEDVLRVIVDAGIPGISLDNRIAELKDDPQISLTAAPNTAVDDSAQSKNVHLDFGERAVVQVNLSRTGIPIRDADVNFTLVGGGAIDVDSADTGQLGLATIEYTPPALSPGDANIGVAVIGVSYLEDGVIYHDRLLISYQRSPDDQGDPDPPNGTDDAVRAKTLLAFAVVDNTDPNGEPNEAFSFFDDVSFEQTAKQIMRDWFIGISLDDIQGDDPGSVLSRLNAVTENNGFPLQTSWQSDPAHRDPEYRQALEEALSNWFEWQASVGVLGFTIEEVLGAQQAGAFQQSQQLVASALTHAVDRVNDRCAARATDYRNLRATSSGSFEDEQQLNEFLGRLILEGNAAFQYFNVAQALQLFQGIETFDSNPRFDQLVGDFCFAVEFDQEMTFLEGAPDNAVLNVKAGLRVDGVEELLVPPSTAPLLVTVTPLGPAQIATDFQRANDEGVFETTINFGDDESPQVLVDVVFGFDETINITPSRKLRLDAVTYGSQIVTLGTSPDIVLKASLDSERDSAFRETDIESINGEYVYVEAELTRGRIPLAGKPVFVQSLGGGSVRDGFKETDANGKISFIFVPPSGEIDNDLKVGRTQIAVAYQEDGETFTDSIFIDYTTDDLNLRDGLRIRRAYSEAQTIAATEAGRHLAIVGRSNVIGSTNTGPDEDLLESIQRKWLTSRLTDPEEPLGLLQRIQDAVDKPERALSVAIEYFRFEEQNAVYGIDDRFLDQEDPNKDEFELREKVIGLLRAAIDAYVNEALEETNVAKAREALALTTQVAGSTLFEEFPEYSLESIKERLGYEIQIREAEVHGTADNAIVSATIHLLLKTPNDGPQVIAEAGGLTVDAVSYGFNDKSQRQRNFHGGTYTQKVSIVTGDPNLEVVLRAFDEYDDTDLVLASKRGDYTSEAGVRLPIDQDVIPAPLPDGTASSNETFPPLDTTITVAPGDSFILETRVLQGKSPVPIAYPNLAHQFDPDSSVSITSMESIAPGRVRVTVGDEPGTLSGVLASTGSDGASFTAEFSQAKVIPQLTQFRVIVSDSIPEGEVNEETNRSTSIGGGLINNSATVAAANQLSVPLAAANEESQLGNGFGLDAIQLPIAGPENFEDFSRSLGNWFSNSLDLLNIVELDSVMDWFSSGLPAQPEDIIRVKLDLNGMAAELPPTVFAADFTGLLPDGFSGDVSLDRPELSGQIVFGIDTSNSPFYVLTQPDDLTSSFTSVDDLLAGGGEQRTLVGREVTKIGAQFGISATFGADELIDGILEDFRAEGHATSKITIDFSDVAVEQRKLRFHELGELTNVKVDFDGDPVESFQAIIEGKASIPGVNDTQTDNALASLEAAGAIYKVPSDVDADAPWQFQLRTADLFELPEDLFNRLATATVDRSETPEIENDDVYEDNDTWQRVTGEHLANLGTIHNQLTLGGQDPNSVEPDVAEDVLALTDAADWYRFETTDAGDATSFVQIDFDQRRGDLDLALYRLLEETDLTTDADDQSADSDLELVRVDGLNFADQARITMLGQPAGTYFVHVFDDRGGQNPFYTLTIDPPGRLGAGLEVEIGDFSIRDAALEINVDSNLELAGHLGGRLVMSVDDGNQVGRQSNETVELTFQAEIDTVAGDDQDNGGFRASVSAEIGGQVLSILDLQDVEGNSIASPTEAAWSIDIDHQTGGYLIFDYEAADNFKFAGLNAAFGRWELGAVTPDSNDGQWRVPEGADFRLPADTAADSTQHRVTLVLQGNQVELWASNPGETNDQRLLSHAYDENLFGRLGIGAPNGRASFDHAELMVERVATPDVTLGSDAVNSPAATNSLPTFATTLFNDSFLDQFDNKWRIEAGIWKSDNGRFVANSSAIKLGDSLLIDSARLTGLLDVQFSDVDIRQIPPLVTSVPVDASDDGYVFASIELSDLNALLFQVADSESGTPLYPNDPDSPEGLVAIRDGGIRLTPAGAVLSAGSASAGIRDVLFVTLNDAKIDLTDDPNVPLLQTGNIEIRIPSLSEDADLVTISGPNIGPLDDDDDPTTDAVYPGLFGLSKPTLSEPIPDFLLLQDEVTIDVNASAIQKKLDVGGVFPFNFDRVGLRFNDVGNTDGQIMNLSDFDLLVSGQIDFDNTIFSSLDGVFTPIFAIDQPDPAPLSDQQRLLSSPDAYQLTCDRGISIFSDDPSIDLSGIDGLPFDERTLCRNGYISTELSLGSLVGNDGTLLKELGPIYVGFKDLNVYEALEITGLVRLGGFQNGEFVPDIVGGIHVVDDPPGGTTNTIATVTVGGRYEGPIVTNPVTNERQTSLTIDLVAESDTSLGEVLGGTIEDAAVNLRGTFINTFTDDSPFNLTGSFEVRAFEAENVCVDLNDYVTLCGSAVVAPAAGPDQPVFVIKEGSLALGSELGPVAGLEIEAGGFGIGRGGELFALNAGYFIPDPGAPDDRSRDLASFPNGAYIALARDAKGGLFGLPDWVPFDVRQIGLSFNGVADPRDPGAPTSPLIVGPPTFDEIQELGSEPEGIRRLGEELVNELVIPITDPDDLSLVISGGLEGTEVIPLTGNVERLKVNLGHLAGCVAIAAENVTDGAALEHVPGYIFDSACEFPIENLNGVKVGIEPVELGPLTVAGTLGLGVFTFDRTPDRPQNVFYGSINGEVAVNGIGLGVEVILTEYGPVLARFKGGAPIPIGTLVGALGGPIGAAAGTASGFILTGLEGGLIFDADPLKVVEEPTDIFTVSELRTPLKIKTSDIENAIRELAFANPTFSQIISEVTDPNSPLTEPLDYPEVLADLLTTGELGDLPLRFTWDDGFRAVVSGTLTNQYVAAQLGLGVTLGFNVGYDFGALLRSDNTLPNPLPPGWPVHAQANASENPDDAPIPAMDGEGFALDREGNRLDRNGNAVAQGITDGLATFDELFGFQLYGFADVEVLGLKLVGAGMLLDFSDPIYPVFNIAAGLPATPSLLSLVLPSQGVIGAQIDTSGYLEGQLLATIAFLETVERDFLDNGDDGSTSSFFYDVLQQMQVSAADGVPSPLEMFAHQREADRRVSTIEGIDLSDPTDPDYDERFDPRKTGYTPNLEDPNNPQRDLWRLILRRDGEDVIQEEITRQLIIDRIFDTSPTRLLPNPSDLDFGDVDLLSLSQITTVFTQEFLLVAQSLLVDDASAEALTSGLAFWGPIETQMTGLRDQVLAGIDDEDERTRFLDAFGVSLNAARVSAAFAAQITRTTFGGYQGAARKLSEVFDPKLRISGELRPTFLGFPMGPPDQSVDVTVSKNELAVQGTFSTLSQVFNMAFLPALVKDSTQIEAYFPFDNLLRDLYEASVPRIDPLADDWRVGIESSMNLFGLQIGNSQGILFPAGATQFLDGTPEQPGKIQKFYGPEHLGTDDQELYDNNPTTLDPNKILVRASEIDESFDNYGRLVDNGGLLVDGRLTLPRFLTDPIAFWDDLQNDPDLRQQLSEFNCDGLGLYECITNHPIETFGVLGNVPTILGDAVTVEEVAQLQLFIPNFIDDVIESLSNPTRAQLDQLMRDPRSTSETIANFISEQVGSAFPAAGSALTNAYLIGTWGQLSDPYASVPFDRTLPPYDEQGVPLTNYTLGFDATDGFNDGDDLDAINETLLTRGVQITSTANELSDTSGLEPVRLIADPENPNNRWLSVGTDP
ncbi:MAG: S8 family serine peptidase, partial [Planctomycetota bacterium]